MKIEACALKSFCGSVEMMASIPSSADSGSLLPVPGLEKNILTALQYMFQ